MGTLLLDGVTLIDGSGAAPLADAALVIEDERIAYAGPRGAAPERAATGKPKIKSVSPLRRCRKIANAAPSTRDKLVPVRSASEPRRLRVDTDR